MKPRPIRIEGDVAYVPLTRGYEAVIDAIDAPLVDGWCWSANVRRHTVYAVRSSRAGGVNRKFHLHRIVMGSPEGLEVDHIDGNGLNNRRHGTTGNLRLATSGQNKFNTRLSPKNKSGFKGVFPGRGQGKWRAGIKVGGRKIHLGTHPSPEEAAAAYARASAEMHGEFGRTS